MARLRADLARILEREPLDLLTAALLLDRLEGPPGDPRTVETTLDTVAQDLQRRLQRAPPGRQRLVEAVRYLQRERGLRPVRPGEADPQAYLLGAVLMRRRGAGPVLALLVREVARRAGLPVELVEADGRLLLRSLEPGGAAVVDPVHGGRHRASGGSGPEGDLTNRPPAPDRVLLLHLLRGLQEAYRQRTDLDAFGEVTDLILLLEPASARDRRDRGLVRLEGGNLLEAKADFRRYLELSPDAPDARVIRGYLEEIDVRRGALARVLGGAPGSPSR